MPDLKPASHDRDTSQLVSHEAEHRKRFHRWQRFHIALFIGSFLCSLAGILAFGLLLKNFDQFCPLFADPRVRWDSDEQRYVFDVNNSTSGSLETCRFCLFTTVASFIYAFLWVWIFCSFFGTVTAIPKERISAPWKVVPPAVLLTCLFSSLMLVCAILVTMLRRTRKGMETWQSQNEQFLHTLLKIRVCHVACCSLLVPQLHLAVRSLRRSPQGIGDRCGYLRRRFSSEASAQPHDVKACTHILCVALRLPFRNRCAQTVCCVCLFFVLFVEVKVLFTDKRVGTAHVQKLDTSRAVSADVSCRQWGHNNGTTSDLSWKGDGNFT
ncbi:uncharacterized protein LOC115311078 isoform X1 [Ixodes scapularis]|uniref:uncharacterized protein LOC115311078 isoform X1 n=1 Tax=Ixodes scapularis TaxID=6945 RepID=UPI001A9CE244|nr:uncharacterized protein LOC115311078 isoform X1 [Ixodes scapularis]